jgi:hypothetical protein
MNLRLGNAAEYVLLKFPALLSNEASAPQYSWNQVRFSVAAGPRLGSEIGASFLTSESVAFLKELPDLFRNLNGKASLHTVEDWIELEIELNSRGGVLIKGRAQDNKTTRIEFEIHSDQSFFFDCSCES